MDLNITTVAQVIEISVAPVFLLAGISGMMVVLTNRLGRAIDRSRSLEAARGDGVSKARRHDIQRERAVLLRRIHFANTAISLSVISAILVCLVIIALFLGSLIQVNVSAVVAGLFIVCMAFLSLAFLMFFLEVLASIRVVQTTIIHAETLRQGEVDANDGNSR